MSAPGTVRVVIPALDAAPTIGDVVAGVRRALPHASVLVVDDGSTDATARVAEGAGAEVMSFERNRGKGAALRAAFAQAVTLGVDAVVTVDADGQHDPSRAPALVAALDGQDIAIGVRRRLKTGMPMHRRFANTISSWAISRCAGQRLPDTQSGFRAIRLDVLRRVQPAGDRYEFETDFLILAARAGFRITGVEIPTIYGAPSHFRNLEDAGRIFATIWRHRREAFR